MTPPFSLSVGPKARSRRRARAGIDAATPALRAWAQPERVLLLFIIILFLPLTATAHPRGFHKRDRVVIKPDAVEVLVTLDVDGGPRASLLRAGADADHDGRLDKAEARALKARLQDLAVRPLEVTLSGYTVRLTPSEAKLSLREDRRVSETGLSVAVLLTAKLPQPVFPGMALVVEDEAPDGSHVLVQAQQVTPEGPGASGEADLTPGQRFTLRLRGAL